MAPSRGPVAVVGEALIDLLDDGNRREAVPGGSAANVALGLARRGIPVRFSTHLGRDAYGSQIADFLAGEGVELDHGSFGAERTSIALAQRNPEGDVSYTFQVTWRMPPIHLDGPMRLFHLGSFPAFSSSLEELLALLNEARRRVPTSWDPNVRPVLAPNREDALSRLYALLPALDIVKLSDADADYLLPDAVPDAIADNLLEHSVRLVVLTLAERGILLATPSGRVRVPAAPVALIDTIGAGDTVMASLIADVVEGRTMLAGDDDLEAVGRRATAAAAITVSRAGADLPRASELALQ